MKAIKGGSIGSIAVFVLLGIVIITGVVLVVMISLQPSYKTPAETTIVTRPDSKPLNLAFPECFDISSDAKQVYSILRDINMEKKYARLLDAYSLALCQQKDFKNSCSMDSLTQRIATLNSWDANMYNKNASDIVNALTKVESNKKGQFLVQVCDVCEKQLLSITNDENIHRQYKTQLKGLNSQFYRNHFDTINRSCP
jgi:hypothetical protein